MRSLSILLVSGTSTLVSLGCYAAPSTVSTRAHYAIEDYFGPENPPPPGFIRLIGTDEWLAPWWQIIDDYSSVPLYRSSLLNPHLTAYRVYVGVYREKGDREALILVTREGAYARVRSEMSGVAKGAPRCSALRRARVNVLPAESFVDLPTWQHIDDCFEKAHWDAGVGVPLRASIPDINMDKKCPDDALLVEEAIGGRYRNILRTADSFANGGLAAAFAAENSLMICADEVLRAAGTSLQAEVE